MPKRIQRRRERGWRMPDGAVYVGRPSVYGNPFPIAGEWIEWACRAFGYGTAPLWTRGMAVALYRWWMTGVPVAPAEGATLYMEPIELTEGTKGGVAWFPGHGVIDLPLRPDLEPLRGHDLACWCPLCETHADGLPLGVECPDCAPCHGAVLLELANR